MNATEPRYRIKLVEQEVVRYHDDVEEWKKPHDDLERDCWVWEELIAKANYLFERLLKLDNDVQHFALTAWSESAAAFDGELTRFFREWLDVSRILIPHAERIEGVYGSADGANKLRENIKAAEAILTPDDEFFTHDKLVELRDQAFGEHQRGETRMLLEDESRP